MQSILSRGVSLLYKRINLLQKFLRSEPREIPDFFYQVRLVGEFEVGHQLDPVGVVMFGNVLMDLFESHHPGIGFRGNIQNIMAESL
jgi:hypothetical protein